jgi:uncharacterized protein (TIGR02231 family)
MAPAPAPLAMALKTAVAGAPAAEDKVALPLTATVAEGQSSVLFTVAQPMDIPADGSRQGTVIALERLPVTPEFVAVPKLSPRVYLKTEVINKTAYPLLAGSINVFNDSAFTGRATMKQVAPGEKFDLFFGADDKIKVKRDMTRVRREGGLISANRISWRCLVELENFRPEGVTVTLMDQLPLPGNEEITATLLAAEVKPVETKADGTLVWKIPLAPGEKRQVTYEIAIDYPKGKEVVGAD